MQVVKASMRWKAKGKPEFNVETQGMLYFDRHGHDDVAEDRKDYLGQLDSCSPCKDVDFPFPSTSPDPLCHPAIRAFHRVYILHQC